LAITFTDAGGGALIKLCGNTISTATLRLRAQIYVPLSLGEGIAYAQIVNSTGSSSGGSSSMALTAGTWTTIDIAFDDYSAAQLGIEVGAGGQGASGTIYIESLEIYR
jgi:hypothetical protein